jgi:hypothetical protein
MFQRWCRTVKALKQGFKANLLCTWLPVAYGDCAYLSTDWFGSLYESKTCVLQQSLSVLVVAKSNAWYKRSDLPHESVDLKKLYCVP